MKQLAIGLAAGVALVLAAAAGFGAVNAHGIGGFQSMNSMMGGSGGTPCHGEDDN